MIDLCFINIYFENCLCICKASQTIQPRYKKFGLLWVIVNKSSHNVCELLNVVHHFSSQLLTVYFALSYDVRFLMTGGNCLYRAISRALALYARCSVVINTSRQESSEFWSLKLELQWREVPPSSRPKFTTCWYPKKCYIY